jgi:outer membrane protein assembly factor BamE (lipoprotein component of BamABCDE complex)
VEEETMRMLISLINRFLNFLIIIFFVISNTFLALVLQSCASSKTITGSPIDETLVAKIRDGETTSEQILTWFGAPTSTTTLGENQVYIYKYCVSKSTGFYSGYFAQSKSEQLCDELTIILDKDGKRVKSHNFIKRITD